MTTLDVQLAALAAAGETITYGVVARAHGLRITALTTRLEAMMEADHAAGRPLLAAVCVGRLNLGLPAEGFFIKAEALGIAVSDRGVFVQEQRKAMLAKPPAG